MLSGIQEGNLNHNIHSNTSMMCVTPLSIYIYIYLLPILVTICFVHEHITDLKPSPT